MAVDTFLKIDGIPGESTDDAHKEWIEVESFSLGHTQSAGGATSTAGARTAGRVNMQDLHFVKKLDKSSAPLALHCANGKHIKEAVLEVCRASESKEKYYEIKLNDIIVSSYQVGGHAGDDSVPTEQISINFGRIEWVYTEMDHKTGKGKGPKMHHWDLTANKGG
jgi:type VI secretion system secreted protein Hcp